MNRKGHTCNFGQSLESYQNEFSTVKADRLKDDNID